MSPRGELRLKSVGALGATKIVLGWPLFLLVGYLTYRIMAPVLRPHDEDVEIPRDEGLEDSALADPAPTTDSGTSPGPA